MTCTSSNISNLQEFKNAIHLYPTIEAVAEDNLMKLKQNNQPIAMIKTVHSGHIAAKGTSDDAGGLEPVLYLAHSARVMLISNLWVETGLVNGAMEQLKSFATPLLILLLYLLL